MLCQILLRLSVTLGTSSAMTPSSQRENGLQANSDSAYFQLL